MESIRRNGSKTIERSDLFTNFWISFCISFNERINVRRKRESQLYAHTSVDSTTFLFHDKKETTMKNSFEQLQLLKSYRI